MSIKTTQILPKHNTNLISSHKEEPFLLETPTSATYPSFAPYRNARRAHKFMQQRLEGHLRFNRSSVLRRLGAKKIKDSFVKDCIDYLETEDSFSENKAALRRLVTLADNEAINENGEDDDDDDFSNQHYKKLEMIDPLVSFRKSYR